MSESESNKERLGLRILQRVGKFHDALQRHVDSGGDPDDFAYPPMPEPPEPVYRTAEEVTTAIINEIETYSYKDWDRLIEEIVSRYRPDSEAERMLDWLDKQLVTYKPHPSQPPMYWWRVFANKSSNIRDAIRAAMEESLVK